MFRLVINGLRYRARRFIGTVLAIVLGVAFLAGTLVLNDTLDAVIEPVTESAMPTF